LAFFAFFLVAMDLFSLFHSSWNFCNDLLLQLFECIESTQNEVKRKMIENGRVQRCTKVTCSTLTRKKTRDITTHSRVFSDRVAFCRAHGANERFARMRARLRVRTFAKLSAIYNRSGFCSDASLERIQGARRRS
jgi:hypothetical protein